jgi:hypothetical protein
METTLYRVKDMKDGDDEGIDGEDVILFHTGMLLGGIAKGSCKVPAAELG